STFSTCVALRPALAFLTCASRLAIIPLPALVLFRALMTRNRDYWLRIIGMDDRVMRFGSQLFIAVIADIVAVVVILGRRAEAIAAIIYNLVGALRLLLAIGHDYPIVVLCVL